MTDIRIRDIAAGAIITAIFLRHRRQPKEAPPVTEPTPDKPKHGHPAITEGWQELGCDFVFIDTPAGERPIPIPTNRPYTHDEQYEFATRSAYLLSGLPGPDEWVTGSAEIYRLMRDMSLTYPVTVHVNQDFFEYVQDQGEDIQLQPDGSLYIPDGDVSVYNRFPNKLSCVVVAESPYHCDHVISLPRYGDDMKFSIHWAGVGRDKDIYRVPFIDEEGNLL